MRFRSKVISGVLLSMLMALTAAVAIGQSKPAANNTSSEPKWEYVVVSYGKTEFGSPQKTLAYRPIGLPAGQEAQDLQNNLDILGRFGWETVAFVGSIGGDQQIVLKRKYDKGRSASEAEAIARGKALYIQDMVDILQREESLRQAELLAEEEARNKPHLIDLDAVDAQTARANLLSTLRSAYIDAFNKTNLASISTVSVEYSNAYSSDIDIEIKVDATKQFLKEDGKSYRRSEISASLQNGIKNYRFADPRLPKYAQVKITARAFIQFEGKPVEVDSYSTRYSTILEQWM